MSDATPATQVPTAERWSIRLLQLVALLWLSALASPVSSLIHSLPSGWPWLDSALAGAGLFVALYVWTNVDNPLARPDAWKQAASDRARLWLPMAALIGLCLALNLGLGVGWFGLFIFTAVSAGLRLSTAEAAWTIAGLTFAAAALGLGRGVAPADVGQAALLIGGIGLAVLSVARTMRIARELRAARAEVARLAVAEERSRVGRDLHDLLGHSLSLVALKCDLAKHLVARDPEQALHEIEDAEAVTRSALKEVRETVAGYRRPTLEAELAAARELLAAAGIGYHCEGPSTTLSGPTEAALAWAVREGVTNVIRHSRARRCEIRFSSEWDGVQLEVTDDGSGPNGNEAHHSASGSSGLVGLSERIARAGGHLETGPGPDGGFRLSVWLPLTSSGQADEAAGKATRG